jgi:hypothetical protein
MQITRKDAEAEIGHLSLDIGKIILGSVAFNALMRHDPTMKIYIIMGFISTFFFLSAGLILVLLSKEE